MRSAEHQEAQKATQYLVDSAYPYGDAVARMKKADAMKSHVRAVVMKSCGESAVSAQQREAEASDEYLAAIDEIFEATREAERIKASREAARIKVDFWRTAEASNR